MTMDLDEVAGKIHHSHVKKRKREEKEKMQRFLWEYDRMSLVDVYSSGMLSDVRLGIIRELKQKKVDDWNIKRIVHPELTEEEVFRKKKAWMEMEGM